MTEIQTVPDETPEISFSDLQPSWAGFGGSEAARIGDALMLPSLRRGIAEEKASDDRSLPAGLHREFLARHGIETESAPVPQLSPDDVATRVKQEGLEGRLPHPSSNSTVLELQLEHAHEEREREIAIARGPNGLVPDALGFATSLGAGMIDPVNAAAFMIPVGGEAFWGSQLALRGGESLLARSAVKAVQGAAQGAVGGAALVPLEWWLKTEDGQDYTMADALKSVLMSAGMGAAFHAGFGSVGDVLRRSRGEPFAGSIPDLQMRAIAGDTRAAEQLEHMGRGVTRQQEPGEAAPITPGTPEEEIPGITATEHPLPAPPAAAAQERSPARQVYDDAREQLLAAGMSPESARYNAAVVAARYDTRAGRLNDGRDAFALYKSEGLSIRRGESPDLMAEYPGRAFAQGGGGSELEKAIADKDWRKIIEIQRQVEGLRAAMRDPETGKIYTGWSHQAAIETVPKGEATGAWGRLHAEWDRATDNAGFVDRDGTFISRDEADKRWKILTMEDAKDFKKKSFFQAAKAGAPADLFAEREAEGQAVLPGGERISDAELAQRRADQALKPKVAQKPMDVGLFGDESKQKTLFQSAPTFYSAVERAVASAKQERASPEQWLATIKNTQGVKAEEMEWLGLADWLKEQKGAVTKQQVTDYVRANAIEVKEVAKSSGVPVKMPYEQWLEERYTGVDSEHARNLYNEQIEPGSKNTKFKQHTLPGGENYRELLLTLPPEEPNVIANRQARQHDLLMERHQIENSGALLNGHPDVEWSRRRVDQINSELGALNQPRGQIDFQSPHWDEPNILAHVRFDDRTVDGKRTLHIAEVQSDWHQKGRKQGYQFDAEKRLEELTREHGELNDVAANGNPDAVRKAHARQADIVTEMNKLHDTNRYGVPDAPFKTTWPELSLKRMIRYAAENGYDQISWDTGATNADRYDLSKQVQHIESARNFGDSYRLHIYPKDGSSFVRDVPTRELPEVVGKDLADKIVAYHDQPGKDAGTGRFSGLDLKVGGEGMRGFYDKMLPAAADKLGKKFGAKVEQSSIDAGRGQWRYSGPELSRDEVANAARGQTASVAYQLRDIAHAIEGGSTTREAVENLGSIAAAEALGGKTAETKKTAPVHTLPITPQLRDAAIRQGFPLFQSGEAGSPRGRITIAQNRAVIDLFAKADRSTFMHEAGHLWLEEMIRDGTAQDASQGIKDDLKTILDWLGVAKPQDITTAHHEQWARAFERYLAEGKAPSSRLAQAFEKFKEWLTSIYHSLASLDAPLSADVRGVMDRMLASDEEIAEARNAPPHPAEALADLPLRAREDAVRATAADLIAGRLPRGAQMLAEAAKEDPRIAESLQGGDKQTGHFNESVKAISEPRAAPPIDSTHDIVSGANSSRNPNGPVYIDRRIPELSPQVKDRNGQPANLWKYLSTHERDEAQRMARGEPYDAAHQGATAAERAAVEADGVDWAAYTHEIDGYLSAIEHERAENPPPAGATHVDPQAAIGHHRSENKHAPPSSHEGEGANATHVRARAAAGPRARPEATWSLFEFLASRGGIRDDDPNIQDLRDIIGAKNKFIPGFGNLIRKPRELSSAARMGGKHAPMFLDRAREAALEADYIEDAGWNTERQATSTVRTLLEADWRKFADVQHPVAEPDLAAASLAAEKTPEPESTLPAKAVSAAQKAASDADALLADILPKLTDDERAKFEDALRTLDLDRDAHAQIVQEGAACLAAAAA